MEKTIGEARRLYLEQYGSALVTNSYLKVALFGVTVCLTGTLVLAFVIFAWAKNQKPLVVRIDEVGRAAAVDYHSFTYSPAPPELRYFLAQFVQLHYSRLLGSAEEGFAKSLFFLDAKLSQVIVEDERKTHSLAVFAREGAEEIDVEVKNIALQDLRSTPMKASVDFDKIFFARGQRKELRRLRYAGYFEFVVQNTVPNEFILVNPLGLTVTYFRIDEAFRR